MALWFLDVDLAGPSHLVDVHDDLPPRRLTGSTAEIAKAVAGAVPKGEPIVMDATGLGLALANHLRSWGHVVCSFRPIAVAQ